MLRGREQAGFHRYARCSPDRPTATDPRQKPFGQCHAMLPDSSIVHWQWISRWTFETLGQVSDAGADPNPLGWSQTSGSMSRFGISSAATTPREDRRSARLGRAGLNPKVAGAAQAGPMPPRRLKPTARTDGPTRGLRPLLLPPRNTGPRRESAPSPFVPACWTVPSCHTLQFGEDQPKNAHRVIPMSLIHHMRTEPRLGEKVNQL